jgi:rsbT co-antagonist protein RsbR
MAERLSTVSTSPAATDDPRILGILATLARLIAQDADTNVTASGSGDALDQISAGLNQLADGLAARQAAALATEQRLEELVDLVGAMAALDFTKRATVGEEGTALDALSFGLNTLREEVAASMVSKDYVDNILDSMNDALVVLDHDQTILTVNRAVVRLFGYPKEDLIGKPGRVLFEQEELAATLARTIAQGQSVINQETTCRTSDGQLVPVAVSASAMHDPNRSLQGIVCILQDITERKRAEETARQNLAQEETIRAQNEMLMELSTPLIPISGTIMVMPLIGSLDSRRAQRVLETLLHGISETRAEVVLLDITGVPIVDTQVANALLHAAQAVKLLGAQVILTGIRPEVAQTLVGLGLDLRAITTHSTLQSGIAATLRHLVA